MKDPLVSIILVNWNGKAYIGECLRALGNITYRPYEVIVVDNASIDGSVSYIKRSFPKVRVIKNKKNIGFAQGNNTALPITRGKFILLLNTDTSVDPRFLTQLVESIQCDESIGVVQPKVLLALEKERIDSVGAFFLPTGLLYHFGREKIETMPQYNHPIKIFTAKGVCMLIRKSVIDKIGLFDPDYFAYFEETDFCMRVWLSGWSVWYEPNARIYHQGGAAFAKQPTQFIYFHSVKNMFCTYLKNLSPFRMVVITCFLFVFFFGAMINFLLKRDGAVGYAILCGIWWNIRQVFKTHQKRQLVQSFRRVSDGDYLADVTKPVSWSYHYHQYFGNLRNYHDIPILFDSE